MSDFQIWTEKYRPKTISECVLPESIRQVAEGIVAKQKMPNLLLAGSAGTGKTTLAKALCNEFGYDNIIVNCSNERSIDVLRTTITQFASSVSLTSDMKVCILDEFDYAGPVLQAALRNFMEEFHKTTRFILTCNYPQRIIQPLHSRCSVLDFSLKASDKAGIASRLMKRIIGILSAENVAYDKNAVAQLIFKYFPDFRRTINELQRYASINGEINDGVISASKGLELGDYANALKNSDFKTAKKWIVETLSIVDQNVIFRKIYDALYDLLEPSSIPAAILIIANYQHRAVTAVDPEVNMAAMSIELMSDCTFK